MMKLKKKSNHTKRIQKKERVVKSQKIDVSLSELTYQTHGLGHEIKIIW